MKTGTKFEYVIEKEDLHRGTREIVAQCGDSMKIAEQKLQRYTDYAEQNCIPAVYSIKDRIRQF